MCRDRNRLTYRQKYITPVHQDHNQGTDPSEVSIVAQEHEDHSYNVVRHHLQVIFSLGFSIEDKYLMRVESGLTEVIEFHGARNWDVRIASPDVDRVKELGWQLAMDILSRVRGTTGFYKD